MDIYRISSDLHFLNEIGETLSTEEKIYLEIGLAKILETEKIDQLLFWGRIRGTNHDYYIALGLCFQNQYEFPTKRFYWSTNNFCFTPLPYTIPQYAEKSEEFRSYFTGNPDLALYTVQKEDDAQENVPAPDKQNDSLADSEDLEEEKNKKPVPDKFTELDRLAYVVRAIENDCAVIPCGAFKLTPTHELRYDDNFRGLARHESNNLQCWQHFRQPQNEKVKENIMKDESLFYKKFLDSLEEDKPIGCWTVQQVANFEVSVKNLNWPGMIAYHKPNSKIFGYCYFGSGQKNEDLAFLL